MNEKDILVELHRLRTKYPNVTFQGRSKKVDASLDILVQFWYKSESTMKCRLIRPSKTKYLNIFDFEPTLMLALQGKPVIDKKKRRVLVGPRDMSPMQYGKGLIGMLGGTYTWCSSKYLAVYLPEYPEYMLPSWKGWLRFMEWSGKNPHRRLWSDAQRYMLMSSGQYAWIVVMDRGANHGKLVYSGGTKIDYDSSWFSLANPAEMLKALVKANEHADEHKWRSIELAGLDLTKTTGGFDDPVQRKKNYMKKYRQSKRARGDATHSAPPDEIVARIERLDPESEPRIEITRVPEFEEEFNDPLTPDGWNGDLGKRYQD